MNEFELVHLTGTAVNNTEIVDNDFGIVAHNSYRLKRKVEMFQWREICKTENSQKKYIYDRVWSETRIPSESFAENGHNNPSNSWPFHSNTFEASNVSLGKFSLRPDQILRLGRGQT